MQNSLEIQVLSSATREQLIIFRDEIRQIEGMESFELKIPPTAKEPGTMSGALAVEITMGLIAGVTHYTSEKTFEYLVTHIADAVKKTFKRTAPAGDEKAMGAGGKEKKWEVMVSGNNDGVKNNIYLDSSGDRKDFSSRQYSINPDKTFALLVGVSVYDDEVHFAAIPPVERNLDDMYRVLNDKRMMGVPIQNINLVFNQTNAVIRKELGKLAQLSDIETLIIYFAGHGQNDGNNRLTLIAKDTYLDDEELCYDIPYDFAEQKINRSTAAQKIILIDACNSGLATQSDTAQSDFNPVKGNFILASTSADKASYYNTEEKNTRFTHYLLDVLNNGISNAKAMISLDDLYRYTKDKLTAKKLPSPTCKSELENIVTDKFYISKNPGFVLADKLSEIDGLYRTGAHEEARKEYRLLIKEYPDDPQVTKAYSNFDIGMQYIGLVNEANNLFYNDKNYSLAKRKYEEAYEIEEEQVVKNKIQECARLAQSNDDDETAVLSKPAPARVIAPMEKKEQQETMINEEQKKYFKKLSPAHIRLIVAGLLAAIATSIIISRISPKEKEPVINTEQQNALPDKDTQTAATPLPPPPPHKDTVKKKEKFEPGYGDATKFEDSIFKP